MKNILLIAGVIIVAGLLIYTFSRQAKKTNNSN